MARLAIGGHTVLGMDMVMPLFSVCHEAAALGCNVDWGAVDAMPDCGKPIWSRAEDVRIPPDFLKHPCCQTPLKAISLLKKRLGSAAAVCGKVFGSWTLGYHLFGVENFLIGTIDDPSQTRRILEKLLPATVAFAKAQIDAGADCITLADHATRDLCSPEAYREFVMPLHARLAELIPAPVILHICGNTSDRAAMIAKTGLSCFHWDTKTAPPADMRRLAGQTLSLMGGVSNLLLLSGRPDEVTAQARRAAQGGIDIVGPECAIPLGTPLANLKAIAAIRL
jgi:[methyl-Co(III) methanol-specific corrinoid protein]:coenzyme M methyltransferase